MSQIIANGGMSHFTLKPPPPPHPFSSKATFVSNLMCCFKTGGALSKETHHTQGKASHQRFVLWPVLGIEVGLKLSGSPTKSSLDVTELISSTSKFMTAVVFYVYLGNCGRDTGARSAEIDLLAHVRRQTAMLLKIWLTNTSILRLSEFVHSVLLE